LPAYCRWSIAQLYRDDGVGGRTRTYQYQNGENGLCSSGRFCHRDPQLLWSTHWQRGQHEAFIGWDLVGATAMKT